MQKYKSRQVNLEVKNEASNAGKMKDGHYFEKTWQHHYNFSQIIHYFILILHFKSTDRIQL